MPNARKVGALCGLLTPAVAFIAIAASILLSPWFSWNSNALSDLGNYARSQVAIIFNTGLLISGMLSLVFGLGVLSELKESRLSKIGAAILIAAGFALACVGIFSEDAGAIHSYVSVAFFSAFPLSLLIIGLATILRKNLLFGTFSIVIALLCTLLWILEWDGVAIPEMISAIFASIWAIAVSLKMLSTRETQTIS